MHLVSMSLKELTYIFPAWRQAASDPRDSESVKVWAGGYKRQMVKSFAEFRIDSIEKIQHGLSQARKSGGDFMPSAGTFAAWCKIYSAPYHKEFDEPSKAIEHMPSSSERFKEELKKLKQINAEARA